MAELEAFQEMPVSRERDSGSVIKPAMRVPFLGLVLFEVIYFSRPEDWLPGVASLPLAKIAGFLAIGTFFLGLVATPSRPPKFAKLMALFFLQLFASVFFSIFRSGSLQVVMNFLNVVIITSIVVYVAVTEARLRRLMFVQAASIFAISVLSVWRFKQGFNTKGRMEGVLGGVFQNANDLALNMAIVLPFALAFLVQSTSILKKLFWGAVAAALVYAIILSSSRGGFLALVAGMAVWLWRIGVKEGRKVWLVLALLGTIGVAIAAPQGYSQRLMSITDADKDATGSSQERQRLLQRSVQVSAQNPLFGVGPGNFQVVSGNWLVSHNAYAQLASEAGIPAFLIFCYIIWDAFACLRKAQAFPIPDDKFRPSILALKASLTALMVGAVFTNISYHYYPYFIFAYCAALFAIQKQKHAALALAPVEEEAPEKDVNRYYH